jgi:predicted RNase H-like HicB family nuclease
MKFNLLIEKDGEGYLAKIDGHENLFAFAYSEKEAVRELKDVVEMMMDFHMEQANDQRLIRNELASTVENYAVQV